MKVFTGNFQDWEPLQGPMAATIGVFDGLHKGHQQLIANVVRIAEEQDLAPMVITFAEHPTHLLAPNHVPKRLTTNEQRLEIFADRGIEVVALLDFNPALRELEPRPLVSNVLMKILRVSYLTVGSEFRFGLNQSGDVAMLRTLAHEFGFGFTPMALYGDPEPFRATSVRAALLRGDLETTNKMLGRPFQIRGEVVHGDARGRTIGFPTANISVGPFQALPRYGVYAVRVGVADERLPGVANIGVRPTFEDSAETIEVHLLEGGRDLYGDELSVDFVSRIRDERKFKGIDELVAQITRDAAAASVMLQPIEP